MDGFDRFSGPRMTNINKKFGLGIQNWLMNKNMGLLTGGGTPQELPWFKGFQEQLNKNANMEIDQIFREATARGIRGGALEQALKQPQEGANSDVLNAILQQYTGAGKTASSIADQSFDQWMKQAQMLMVKQNQQSGSNESTLDKIAKGVNIFHNVLSGPLQGGQMMANIGQTMGKTVSDQTNSMSGMMSGAGNMMGGAGKCMECFIFREANEGHLEESVRKFRDTYFMDDAWVSKGYKRMSRWLVPAMKKSWLLKKAVRHLMVLPTARVARWHEGKSKHGWMLIPVGFFWCFVVWNTYGWVAENIFGSTKIPDMRIA